MKFYTVVTNCNAKIGLDPQFETLTVGTLYQVKDTEAIRSRRRTDDILQYLKQCDCQKHKGTSIFFLIKPKNKLTTLCMVVMTYWHSCFQCTLCNWFSHASDLIANICCSKNMLNTFWVDIEHEALHNIFSINLMHWQQAIYLFYYVYPG